MLLKKTAPFIFISCLLLIFGIREISFCQEWKELKGDHFLVYCEKDDDFAASVLNKAELYYQAIATDIGYPRYSEFWTWDKRVKIYIYPDHAAYVKAANCPEWSQGMADYNNKRILSYAFSKDFLDSILPHEMTHLIFRDFVGFKGEVPLWLDEGIAQWEETAKRAELKRFVKELYESDSLLSVSDMMRLDIRNMKQMDRLYIRSALTKKGTRSVLFLDTSNLLNTYYAQSVSLVGFLIEKYGSDEFASFCRQLRDGKSLEDALVSVYPSHIRSLDDFEMRWREYLDEMN
ncbi:MAG: hypothetical protein PHN57_00610 [Candidatus Omnitrophica bacterium]|nr:hypothetical protein [Candidatus Omnitrophota bacterium]